jgi:hypothetical protein
MSAVMKHKAADYSSGYITGPTGAEIIIAGPVAGIDGNAPNTRRAASRAREGPGCIR